MISVRKSEERGHANHGWLDTYHTFSFADYYDPAFKGFSALRVINEDRIQPAQGFGTHRHEDMEILTYLLTGTLTHKDSLGNTATIRPGELQRMSAGAGTGVEHSEYNASDSTPVHLLQIWIRPEKKGISPGYEQKTFSRGSTSVLVASPDGRSGSLTIHQDAEIYLVGGAVGGDFRFPIRPARKVWAHLIKGQGKLNEQPLQAGDGAGITDETELRLGWANDSEFFIFDLPQ